VFKRIRISHGSPADGFVGVVAIGDAEPVGLIACIYVDVDSNRRVAQMLHLGSQLVVDDPARERQ
jgi:hypothetical protein